MFKVRVIPCLDVKDGRVVKGVKFLELRDAGDPVEAAIAYDAAGADELCFLDITASHENRDTIFDVVQRTADGERHEAGLGGAGNHIEQDAAILMAGRDVEKTELVGTRRVIGLGGFDRIAGVDEIEKLHALDDAAVLDVEAGDDAGFQGHQCCQVKARSDNRAHIAPRPPGTQTQARRGPD